MDIITGQPVTDKNYLYTRLFLVDDLRNLLLKDASVLIDSPRRFGKTSVVKEFKRQEDSKKVFTTMYLDLEGIDSINAFFRSFFLGTLNFFIVRKAANSIKTFGGDFWNMIAKRIPKLKLPEFEIELKQTTREYDLDAWKEIMCPLFNGLQRLDSRFIFAFDEFPDLILSLDKKETRHDVDMLLAWLRALRQAENRSNCNFIFCGSVNLKHTLEQIDARHRIADLENFYIPVMDRKETQTLLIKLLTSAGITVDPDAICDLVDLAAGGPPYFAQIIADHIKNQRRKTLDVEQVSGIVQTMLLGQDHNLRHYQNRLGKYFSTGEKYHVEIVLRCLCRDDTIPEKELFTTHLHNKCEYPYYLNILGRLEHEGYLLRDPDADGALRFVSPLLKRWWACKEGVI